jgi:dTDP-L-rhamnose 4-epimerase
LNENLAHEIIWNMKILITGGAGFIGKWLVRKLPLHSEIVIIDSLDKQAHGNIHKFPSEIQKCATCIKSDIRKIATYRKLIDGTDIVVHLAAQTGTTQSMYETGKYINHNVTGTVKLLETISTLKHKPRRIVLASSRAVYGEGAYQDGHKLLYPYVRSIKNLKAKKWAIYGKNNKKLQPIPMNENHIPKPVSIYGLTKLRQEQLIKNYSKNHNIDFVIYRLQNVYGPGQELSNPYTGIIGIFASNIAQNNAVTLFEDGLMSRDFIYVEDVVDMLIKGIFHDKDLSKTLNIGSSRSVTIRELAELIAKLMNKRLVIDAPGCFRKGDIRNAVADMKLYEKTFGKVRILDLKSGIRAYLDWFLQQKPLSKNNFRNSLNKMAKENVLLK